MAAILTIALLLDTDFDETLALYRGIEEYAQRQPQWRLLPLRLSQTNLLATLLQERRLDGIIGSFISDRWLQGIIPATTPCVNISDLSAILSISGVVTDNQLVGRLAAQHLLQQEFPHFGVVAESASHAATLRRDGFIATLKAAGHHVAAPPLATGHTADATWLAWLAQLPLPCGIFCTSDFLARRLLNHAVTLKLPLHNSIGVVGVGNAPLESLLAPIPISTIELDGFRIGKQAAQLLARLLVTPISSATPPHSLLVPPRQLIPRASSLSAQQSDPLVARAFKQQNFARPLDGEALARACGASRRTLENRFRQRLGCGPATLMRQQRLAHAALLLSNTTLTLEAIAQAVGYAHASAFSAAFRRAYGSAPGAWRHSFE